MMTLTARLGEKASSQAIGRRASDVNFFFANFRRRRISLRINQADGCVWLQIVTYPARKRRPALWVDTRFGFRL